MTQHSLDNPTEDLVELWKEQTMKSSDWYRIDKANGCVTPSTMEKAGDAARAYFRDPADVLNAGRFSSAWAIYSRADCLSGPERRQIDVD